MDEQLFDEEKLKSNQFIREVTTMRLDNEVYRYLGVSLSEIPFIDETTSNTRTNTCQNSCLDLPNTVNSSNFFNYQPLT